MQVLEETVGFSADIFQYSISQSTNPSLTKYRSSNCDNQWQLETSVSLVYCPTCGYSRSNWNNILSSDVGDFLLWLGNFLCHSEIVSHDTKSSNYGNLMFDCFTFCLFWIFCLLCNLFICFFVCLNRRASIKGSEYLLFPFPFSLLYG